MIDIMYELIIFNKQGQILSLTIIVQYVVEYYK